MISEWSQTNQGKKFDAVLFDLDGVLVDSFPVWHEHFCKALQTLNLPVMSKNEYYEKIWIDQNFQIALEKKFGSHRKQIIETVMKEKESIIGSIKPMKKASQTLAQLSDQYPLGVVTNAPLDYTTRLLSLFSSNFQVVMTSDDVSSLKPDPEMIIKACKKLEINPKKVLVVGDTPVDLAAAKEADAHSAGLCPGGDFTISNISDIIPIVRGVNNGSI